MRQVPVLGLAVRSCADLHALRQVLVYDERRISSVSVATLQARYGLGVVPPIPLDFGVGKTLLPYLLPRSGWLCRYPILVPLSESADSQLEQVRVLPPPHLDRLHDAL